MTDPFAINRATAKEPSAAGRNGALLKRAELDHGAGQARGLEEGGTGLRGGSRRAAGADDLGRILEETKGASREVEALTWFVYALVDPRDALIHYVGCTRNLSQRVSSHVSDPSNRRMVAWVGDMRSAGLRPRVRVLAQFGSMPDAHEYELRQIQLGASRGWPLLNAAAHPTTFAAHSRVEFAGRELTRRQLEILRAIDSLARANGFAPTIRELGAAVGIASTNGVNDHLVALEGRNLIHRHNLMARSIVITDEGRAVLAEATTTPNHVRAT